MKEPNNIKTNSLQAWLLAARPKTLAAAVVPVLVGCALAYHYYEFQWIPALACLFFAMLMQVAANLINDLFDYLKGCDGEDRLGPLRATAQGWISKSAMKKGIFLTVLLACTVGSTLIFYGGWEMIPVGCLCAVFACFYTSGPYPLAYNGLGDVAVIVFFGLVATGFTCYVQTLFFTPAVIFSGLATGMVVNTLLVLNNYRDRDTDRNAGKRTVVVRFGEPFGRYLYLFSGVSAVLIVCIVFTFEKDTAFTFKNTLIPILILPYLIPHFFTWRKIGQIRVGKALNSLIGETSRNMLFFALLLSFGLMLCR
jgi:1,4-dihydroxy-2-naphthoate octaprenyltransferase